MFILERVERPRDTRTFEEYFEAVVGVNLKTLSYGFSHLFRHPSGLKEIR